MSSPLVQYQGVDWITCTSQKDDAGMAWWEIYTNYRREMVEQAEVEKSYHNGWYGGVRIANLQWGYSESLGYIIIASGGLANELWKDFQPVNHRITRFDLCVDFELSTPEHLARYWYYSLSADKERRFPKLSLWESSGPSQGATLYVGSRQSQQFGRLYDKGAQKGTAVPHLLWRAEVEYKKPKAQAVAVELYKLGDKERGQSIVSTVIDWYEKRGVVLPIDEDSGLIVNPTIQETVTTVTRKLTWLSSQVRPSVQQLIEAGLGKNVLLALGLDERQWYKIFDQDLPS